MSETLAAQSAEVAYGAMNEAAIGGGTLLKAIGAAVKALIGQVGVIGEAGIVLAITTAYDRLTAGDNPWLPGTNADPTSLEAQVEKMGRDGIPTAVHFCLALLA